ncbi:MAG: phage major capsid protein [Lachnospiraceae bacterium]|nr:phage major capsid protein [Lachnospiraceae bacterium]
MFKFKNYEDYVAQRNDLLAVAEGLINGDQAEYDAAMEQVNAIDEAYTAWAQRQSDLAALQGAAKAPVTVTGVNKIIDRIIEEDDEMEYRTQFMNYVMKGTPIKMTNQDEVTTTDEVGAVIPRTVVNKIVEKIEKIGNLLNLVTRTYYKGGVVIPTSAAKPTASWVAERGDVDTQQKAVGSIVFAYNKLKCKVAISLEVSVVTLDIFERTLIDQVSQAMAKALDEAIVKGRGLTTYHEPKGILAETVVSGQNVDVTESNAFEYSNLIAMEAALPEGYDDAIYVMNKKTFISQVIGMVDSNKQPIARVDSGLDGKPSYNLFGRHVEFTSALPAYTGGTVTADTVVAFLFRMEDYYLNTNMKPTIKRYTDEDTDDEITKCIMLADGAVVDKNSLVTLTVKNS